MKGNKKDLQKLAKLATRHGWKVVRTGGDHLAWYAPDGKLVYVSASTPRSNLPQIKIQKFMRAYGVVIG